MRIRIFFFLYATMRNNKVNNRNKQNTLAMRAPKFRLEEGDVTARLSHTNAGTQCFRLVGSRGFKPECGESALTRPRIVLYPWLS